MGDKWSRLLEEPRMRDSFCGEYGFEFISIYRGVEEDVL